MKYLSCFIQKNFSWKDSSRFVFQDEQQETPAAAPEAPPVIPTENPEQLRGEILQESQAQRADLASEAVPTQMDHLGNAKDYVETFNNPRKLEGLSNLIQFSKDDMPEQLKIDFELWPEDAKDNPEKLFDLFANVLPMPHGKGRNMFINGFNPSDPDYARLHAESVAALPDLIKILKSNLEKKRESKVDTKQYTEKNPLLGTTMGEIKDTLKMNYDRAGGWEKAAMIGAAGILLWYAWTKKDEKFPGQDKYTWGDICKWSVGLVAFNYMWGKASKSGQTLTQKIFDVMPNVDSLEKEDNPLRGFAENHGMRENQEKFRTLTILHKTDIKSLYKEYKEAKLHSPSDGPRSISPESLGFKKNAFDGALTFDIMDNIVWDTAVNELTEVEADKVKLAAETGTVYTPRSPIDIAFDASQDHNLFKIFEDKYVNGSTVLGNLDRSLEDVIHNEYPPHVAQRVVNLGQRERFAPGTIAEVKRRLHSYKDKARLTYEKNFSDKIHSAILLAKAGGNWVQDKYETAKTEYVLPAWHKGVGLFRRHIGIPLETKAKEVVAHLQERELTNMLPADFGVKVTSPNKATILGYPNVDFDYHTRNDGQKVLIVDGSSEILVDKGLTDPDNIVIFEAVKNNIKAKVEKLIKEDITTRNATKLQNKDVEWDSTDKKWKVKKVTFEANPDLPGLTGGEEDMTVEVAADGKKLRYFILNRELLNGFNTLDREYATAKIEDVMLNDPRNTGPRNQIFGQLLKGSRVEVTNIFKTPAGQTRIEGTIGGLKFNSPLADNADFTRGINFYGTPIRQNNGGPQFIEGLVKNIDASDYVNDAFLELESQMDNIDEGAWDRIKAATGGRTWVMPNTAVNGKVLNKQWKYTLRFKRDEMLDRYRYELQKSGSDVNAAKDAYEKFIEEPVKHLMELATYIDSIAKEDRPDHFKSFLSAPHSSSPDPAGLEFVNYNEQTYGDLFKEYQRMISEEFNYEGLDNSDLPFSDSYHEAYYQLLKIWSYHTIKFANGVPDASGTYHPLSTAKQNDIRTQVIDAVRRKLNGATAGGKALSIRDLPRTDTDIERWITPTL